MDQVDNNWLDKTRQTYHQTYNYIKLNQKFFESPLAKMLFEVKSFAECFDDTEDKIKLLEAIYIDPILFLVKKYPKLFNHRQIKRINLNKSLPLLEWIFYRDSHRFTQLKQKYYIDEEKPSGARYITFGDIATIKGHIEKEISQIFNEIVSNNNFALENPFSAFPQMEKLNVNEFAGGL